MRPLALYLVVGVAAVCLGNAKGFIPSGFRAFFGGAPGRHHAQQTKDALRYVAAAWFNANPQEDSSNIPIVNEATPDPEEMFVLYYGPSGKRKAKVFKKVIETIARNNAKVDDFFSETSGDPTFHFDAERFYEANERVAIGKSQAMIQIEMENYEQARATLGKALHTLQDFYSHSNWIENGFTVVNTGIGDKSHVFNVASFETRTCVDCDDSKANETCHSNIVTPADVLTSGYFVGVKPTGKCSHGNSHDETIEQDAQGGINKDSTAKKWSPHYYLHEAAAQLSVRATRYFIEQIREQVDDYKFRMFLGLGSQKSLAIVMDTTGSMGRFIEAAKQRSFEIIDEAIKLDEGVEEFILVPFNDPDFGPVLKTKDPNTFKQSISALYADGGDDIPEMCYSGIQLAVEAAMTGTSVFVFTDAPAKDGGLQSSVSARARDKGISISFVLGTYGTKRKRRQTSDPTFGYSDFCQGTGGMVIRTLTSTAAVFSASSIIQAMIDTSVVTVYKASAVNLPYGKFLNLSVTVDTTATSLSLLVSGSVIGAVSVYFEPPAATASPNVTTTSTDYMINAVVNSPQPGTWLISMVSLSTVFLQDVRVVSSSQYDASCSFKMVDVGSPHPGLQSISGNPLAGSQPVVWCSSTSASFVLSSVTFVSSSTNQILSNYSLSGPDSDSDSESYVAMVTVPQESFFITVLGMDVALGANVTRVMPTTVTPCTVALLASVANGTYSVTPGSSVAVQVQVTNNGTSDSFSFTAVSSINSVRVNVSSPNVTLQNGQTYEFTIECFAESGTPVAQTATIQLIAQAYQSPGNQNFLQFFLAVSSNEVDSSPPVCNITFDSYSSLCSASSLTVGNCTAVTWNASVLFVDAGTGVMSTVTKASLLDGAISQYPALANASATSWNVGWNRATSAPNVVYYANFSSSCCVQSADFVAMDFTGLTTTCTVGQPKPAADYLTIPPVNLTDPGFKPVVKASTSTGHWLLPQCATYVQLAVFLCFALLK